MRLFEKLTDGDSPMFARINTHAPRYYESKKVAMGDFGSMRKNESVAVSIYNSQEEGE